MNNVYKTQGVDKKSIGFKRRYKDNKRESVRVSEILFEQR